MRVATVSREHDAVVGVVAGIALAQVVEQRAHEQQVGATHRAHDVVGARHRLEEVTVDGEAVERVALRLAAHPLPLGEVVHEEAALVEQLDQRHHRVAPTEERDERVAGVVAPRLGSTGPSSASKRRSVGRAIGAPR